jgi:protein phosphatase
LSKAAPITFLGPEDGLNCSFKWTGRCLHAHLCSDLGRKRHNNEDSCLLCAPEEPRFLERRGVLFAVADGMGGASAGERASRLALETIAARYYDETQRGFAPIALRGAIEAANDAVYDEAEGSADYAGMGTTASVLAIMGNWAYIAQVGDSRIYLSRKGLGLKQLTDDHSLVAEQMRNGLINAEEARTHLLKNLITRAVGIRNAIDVDLFALELRQGDTLLICSDGLSNMVSDDEIMNALAMPDLGEATDKLIAQALEAGGSDNVTVVALRVTGIPPLTHYQQGAQKVSLGPPSLWARLKKRFFS